jgi:hypothetical protein
VHSAAVVHTTPFGFLPQMVPLHTKPVAQSASVAQLVLHAAVPLHTYGLHAVSGPAAHIPVPLQRPAAISAPLPQLVAPHTVPDAYVRQAPMPLQAPSRPQLIMPASAHCIAGS